MVHWTKRFGIIVLCSFLLLLAAPIGVLAQDEPAGFEESEPRQPRARRGEHRQQYCSENPDDERCQRFQEHKRRREICRDNPDTDQCRAWKEEARERHAQLRELCESDPDNPRCRRLRRGKRGDGEGRRGGRFRGPRYGGPDGDSELSDGS